MQPEAPGQTEPISPPQPRPLAEAFVPAVLVVLGGPLVVGWTLSGMLGGWTCSDAAYVFDLVDLMFNRWLLPALGLTLVLQCRSLDLSVWMGFALGSAVGAAAVGAGAHPVAALAAVLAAGAALGLVNAAAVTLARVPGVVATGVSSLACYGVAWLLTGGQAMRVNPEGLVIWSGANWPMRLTAGLYIVAMLTVLFLARLRHRVGLSRRSALAAAMVGSGVLSALGGLCWLARSGQAPPPSWRLIDLRVVAAAALAGAVVLRGPGRNLLAGVFLPPAMLVATVWQYQVWDVPDCPVAVSLLALTGMVLAAQWGLARSAGAGAVGRVLCPALAAGGIAIVAVTVIPLPQAWRGGLVGRNSNTILSVAGAAVWLAGTAGALLWRRKRAPAGPAPGPA